MAGRSSRNWKGSCLSVVSMRWGFLVFLFLPLSNLLFSIQQQLFSTTSLLTTLTTTVTSTNSIISGSVWSSSTTTTNDKEVPQIFVQLESDDTVAAVPLVAPFALHNNYNNNTDSTNPHGCLDPPWVVFYNVYAPHNMSSFKERYIEEVVREQLQQLVASYASSHVHPSLTTMDCPSSLFRPLRVYYTTIGQKVQRRRMIRLCRAVGGLDCRHLQHYEEGLENVTLQHLHHYCQTHTNAVVIYLHPKGSFHRAPIQHPWRRAATAAATSRECLQALSSSTCNVCGLFFQPLPYLHFTGNMFAASCRYVQQLLPPTNDVFQDRLTRHFHPWVQSQQRNRTLVANLFNIREPMHTGEQRYLWEHWTTSHPGLQPCDVSAFVEIKRWFTDYHNYTDVFEFQPAPRHAYKAEWSWQTDLRRPRYKQRWEVLYGNNNTLTKNSLGGTTKDHLRLCDYFLLRGVLQRYLALYNETLPDIDSSWVWSWYPDGNLWQQAARRYGTRVVQAMEAQYCRTPLEKTPLGFPPF